MHLEKRGQATLFIILGILVIILVSIALYYRSSFIITDPATPLDDETQNIQAYIQECFVNALENALFISQKQSGHLYITGKTFVHNGAELPYIYADNTTNTLQPEQLEAQFQAYLVQQLLQCSTNLNATFEDPATSVAINAEGISARLFYPFSISLSQATIRNDFIYTYSINVPLYTFLSITQELGKELQQQPEGLPIHILLNQTTFNTTTYYINNTTLVALIPKNDTNQTYYITLPTLEAAT